MPDWDQWDAEAVETLIPWFKNDHFLQHLFHPHNEHRVILTKLQNLALVLLNGQWDSRLEAVTNALLHAALAAAFWLVATRSLALLTPHTPHPTPHTSSLTPRFVTPLASSLLFLLVLALFALPVAWQNVLGGFHSQQYWLLGLSFAALVTLPFARAWSAAWWLGAVSGILALGSMASGFLAAAVVIAILAFRLARRETTLRAAWPTLLFCAALVAVGLATRVEVPWHAEMKAKSARDFAFSLLHSLQWPWRERHWAAPIVWLPWFLLFFRTLRPSVTSGLTPLASRLAQTALGLGAWVLLQLLATAYARGAGADNPASRYMDTLAIGVLANALALVCLLLRPSALPRFRDSSGPVAQLSSPNSQLLLPLLALAWLLTIGFGVRHLLRDIVQWELADAKQYYLNAESNLRRYLATNDPRHLAQKDIPYPDPAALAERLVHPSLRPLMPVPLRPPLALTSTPDSSGFLPNNATGPAIDIENPPRAGLSPATPPLDYATTWGSFSATVPSALWRSTPLEPTGFAFLKFEVAGDVSPSLGPVSLELQDARTGERLARIQPTRTPGNNWRSAYVPMPRVPFVVHAVDRSPTHWLAFSGPVEMGRFSFLAYQATRHGLLIFQITATFTFGLAALAVVILLRAPRAAAPA